MDPTKSIFKSGEPWVYCPKCGMVVIRETDTNKLRCLRCKEYVEDPKKPKADRGPKGIPSVGEWNQAALKDQEPEEEQEQ